MSTQPTELRIDIGLESDAAASELDEATLQLQEELSELDVDVVERPKGRPPPPGARAVEAAALGTLIVGVSRDVIGAVVRTLASWASRSSRRAVKVQLGDDTIEISDVSRADQRRLLEAFLARHGPEDANG